MPTSEAHATGIGCAKSPALLHQRCWQPHLERPTWSKAVLAEQGAPRPVAARGLSRADVEPRGEVDWEHRRRRAVQGAARSSAAVDGRGADAPLYARNAAGYRRP